MTFSSVYTLFTLGIRKGLEKTNKQDVLLVQFCHLNCCLISIARLLSNLSLVLY